MIFPFMVCFQQNKGKQVYLFFPAISYFLFVCYFKRFQFSNIREVKHGAIL